MAKPRRPAFCPRRGRGAAGGFFFSGPRSFSRMCNNLVRCHVSSQHLLKGPNHSVVTAGSTGAHAIGDAARLIALGDANVMVAGGAESPLDRLSMAGFAACRALSTAF